jgi:UDP-N-acetylenolpyruvoylglucosamine reductase
MTATRTSIRAEPGGDRTAPSLRTRVTGETVVRENEPLAKHTTMRVGGPADVYIEPAGEADLKAVLEFCATENLQFFVLGRGSNLLVRDGGFRGVVICLAHPFFSRVEVAGECLVCGAGAKLKTIANEARRHGLEGLEFLEGIPGSLGGALRMNAGAMGGAAFEVVESVRAMSYDGQVAEFAPGQMDVTYRRCGGLQQRIALAATLRGRAGDSEAIRARMRDFSEKRWASQPAAPSAGCVFKNPAGIPAGRLIDELGLKGTQIGGARVSLEHGNFLVNDGDATARDLLALAEMVRGRAKSERGIELELEVQVIGTD